MSSFLSVDIFYSVGENRALRNKSANLKATLLIGVRLGENSTAFKIAHSFLEGQK